MSAAKRWGVIRFALVVALVTAGCGSTAPTVKEPAAADTSVAASGARDLMKEIYGSLRRGSTGGLLPLVDATVVAVGPGPGDVFTDRSAALVALGEAVTADEKHKLTSTDLHVVASPAGHAAWASDVIAIDGKRYVIGVVMIEADELWTVAAIQIGAPITAKQRDSGPVPEPKLVPPPATGADKSLSLAFKTGTASPAALADQVAKNPDAVALDLAGRSRVGFRAIRKAWKKEYKGALTVQHGEVYARIAPDGTMGWVLGAVDVTAPKHSPVPTRMLHVYDKTADGWELVLANPSIALAR